MAARNADNDERFEEEPRSAKSPPRPRDDGIQTPKPRPAQPPRDEDDYDDRDDRPRRGGGSRPPERRRNDDGVSTIIPYHNGMALAGYYLGVFGLIPVVGFILGPLAIIFGIIGLRKVNRNPEVKGTGHSITAIILGGLSTLGHYGLLLFFILGRFMR